MIVTGLIHYIISEYRASHADWRRVQALYAAENLGRACGRGVIADPDALGPQGCVPGGGRQDRRGDRRCEATIAGTNSDEMNDPMEASGSSPLAVCRARS